MAKELETAYGPVTAVADWLRANDIDPNDVPIDGPITIERETASGKRVIRYAALLRNEDGHHYLDRATQQAAREDRTAPLQAEPPANVQVTESQRPHRAGISWRF